MSNKHSRSLVHTMAVRLDIEKRPITSTLSKLRNPISTMKATTNLFLVCGRAGPDACQIFPPENTHDCVTHPRASSPGPSARQFIYYAT